MYDVVVVGAGVSGCRTAELVASKDKRVLLLEKRGDVGKPVQCAGLVSHRLKKLLPDLSKDIILNKVRKAKFFSSNSDDNPILELESSKPVYVVDRERLDKCIFQRAKKAGCDIKLSTKFIGVTRRTRSIEANTNEGNIKSKIIVGADGPNSIVARKVGLKKSDNYLTGVQGTVEGEFDDCAVELWFGSEIAPRFFAWLIPESSDSARIGLATRKNALEHFKKFLEMRMGKSVKPDVGGMINFGVMKSTATDRVLVVGDAACQVKPFSGGGVIYSLIGARYAAEACVKSLQSNIFRESFLKENYDKKWKQHLKGPIRRGLLYRKMLIGSDVKTRFLLKAASQLKFILEDWDIDLL